MKHAGEPPPPLRQFNPQVPPAVEAVVLKALAKPPEQRHQTAGAFAADYARALQTGQMPQPYAPAAGAGATMTAPVMAPPVPTAAPVAPPGGPAYPTPTGPPSYGQPFAYQQAGAPPPPPRRSRAPLYAAGVAVGGLAVVICATAAVLLVVRGAGEGTTARSDPTPAASPSARLTPAPPATVAVVAPTAAGAPAPPTAVAPAATQPAAAPPAPPAATAVPATPDVRAEVRKAVENSNTVWAIASFSLEPERLREVYAGTWLTQNMAAINQLKAEGKYRDAIPREIRQLSVEVTGDQAVVKTHEVWADRVYFSGSKQLVSERDPWVLDQTYFLQRIDGRWYVVDARIT
jgi:hypothetical protein